MMSRIGPVLAVLSIVLAACSLGSQPSPDNGHGAGAGEQAPWWEGRTWQGETQVCVDAVDDPSGCEWLADFLMNRGCHLRVYQTFVASIVVGASLDMLLDDAVARGECPPVDSSPAAAG